MRSYFSQQRSVVRAPALRPKDVRFDSQSRTRNWIVGFVPCLMGVCTGGDQLMCLYHINVSLSPLSLPSTFCTNQ